MEPNKGIFNELVNVLGKEFKTIAVSKYRLTNGENVDEKIKKSHEIALIRVEEFMKFLQSLKGDFKTIGICQYKSQLKGYEGMSEVGLLICCHIEIGPIHKTCLSCQQTITCSQYAK